MTALDAAPPDGQHYRPHELAAAFEAILHEKRLLLLHVAAAIAGYFWAEDIVQEAATGAWLALPRFVGGPGELLRWLITCTGNAARDRRRMETLRHRHDAGVLSVDAWTALTDLDEAGDPLARAVRREDAQAAAHQVAGILSRFPARHRDVLWQAGAEGRPLREVAARRGEAHLAVKYVWLRAAGQVRRERAAASGGRQEVHD